MILLDSLETTRMSWVNAAQPSSYPEAMSHLVQFAEYKKTNKRGFVKERQELAALYSNIQTKLRTYALRAWEPKEGLRLIVGDAHGVELINRIWSIIGRHSYLRRAREVERSMPESESAYFLLSHS